MIDNVKKYQIEKATPTTYLDKLDKVINGFLVRFVVVEFDETYEINLPDIETDTVKEAIEKLISDREAIRDLG